MTRKFLRTIKLGALALAVWIFVLSYLYGNTSIVAIEEPAAAPANDKLVWHDNYRAALEEAKATGKPIFLEFRCAPWVNGRKFDAQVVLTPKNSPRGQLMQQYVLARITTMAGIDIALFDYDRHNSIYFFVLNADEQIYLRYGGRDSEDAGAYHSLDSLTLALEAGLKQHALYRAGRLPKQPRPAPMYPQEIASLKREVIERNRCVECHLIGDYKAQDEETAGTLDKRRTMYPSPDLKTIAIHPDVPKGLVVDKAEGPAERAGMRAGDLITAFNRTSVLTFGDLQYRYGKLDRDARRISLTVERQGNAKSLTIRLPVDPSSRKKTSFDLSSLIEQGDLSGIRN